MHLRKDFALSDEVRLRMIVFKAASIRISPPVLRFDALMFFLPIVVTLYLLVLWIVDMFFCCSCTTAIIIVSWLLQLQFSCVITISRHDLEDYQK